MTLTCGCNFNPWMLVSREVLQAHYKHTVEALLFWELIRPQGETALEEGRLTLLQARINLVDAINELYPEAIEVE